MAYTLSDLLSDTYAELGHLQVGAASGGDTDSLTDDELAGEHRDDEWQDGALFVLAAGGAAPEGEYARVAAFDAAGGAFTLAGSLSAAVEAGDRYGLASSYYPLETLIELANSGLRGLGDIALVDESVLVSVSGQSSYAASLEWKRRRPLRIDFLAIPGLSAVDPWRTVHDWDFVPAAPGSTALILFKDALPAGRPVRVWYQAAHPRLAAHDDVVHASIHPELAVAAAAERALRWQNARLGGDDPGLAGRWELAREDLARARAAFPIWKPARAARLLATK